MSSEPPIALPTPPAGLSRDDYFKVVSLYCAALYKSRDSDSREASDDDVTSAAATFRQYLES